MDVNPTPSAITVAPAAEQSGATTASDEFLQRILARIIESSEPVPAPALWERFGKSGTVRRFLCEATELLSRLSQHFTADQLLAERVAVRTQSGGLDVAQRLATDEVFLIRGDASGRASDFVNHHGKLSGGKREWCDLAAKKTDGNSTQEKPVVLCADDAELYVLARLGISCSPMARIDQLNGQQVRSLFKNRALHVRQRGYQIVLLGWQLPTLVNEPSAKNLVAIRHVAAIRTIYSLDPHAVFSVWVPTDAELVRIRLAHSFADREAVADELRSSLQKSLYPPAEALALLADRKPPKWAKARAELESAIQRSNVAPRVFEADVALEKLARAFHDQVLRPLEAAVRKTGLEALHSIMAADLATQWYQDLGLVHAAHSVIAGQFSLYAKRVDDAALNRKLRLVIAIVKLAQAKFKK